MNTQGNKCPICLKVFVDPRWMPCTHIYCFKCIPRLRRRRDPNRRNLLVLECRICARRFSFSNWSTLKYYATLYCVPYLKAIQFTSRAISSNQSSCSACFQKTSDDSSSNQLEYCSHCQKNLCRPCSLNHRNELKKTILNKNEQSRLISRKHQQRVEEIMDKLNHLKAHLDYHAFQLLERVCAKALLHGSF
jgi:hypothetical protein